MFKTSLFTLLLGLFTLTQAVEIKMYTEHYPPYNYKAKDGSLTGSSVEILAAVLKQLHSKQTISDVRLRNWSKSYIVAQKVKDAMVFSTTRTDSREELFHWVGPIATATVGIIALKKKHIRIKKASDLNKYTIGAVLNDIGETLLLEKGVKREHIQNVPGEDAINLSFTKMQKGRIDMFAYNTNVALSNAAMEGFDTSKYELVYTLKVGYQYFAFNKKTNKSVIQEWQNALDKLKKDGTYDKIQAKYK